MPRQRKGWRILRTEYISNDEEEIRLVTEQIIPKLGLGCFSFWGVTQETVPVFLRSMYFSLKRFGILQGGFSIIFSERYFHRAIVAKLISKIGMRRTFTGQ